MTFKADEGWEEPILTMLGRWAITLFVVSALIVLSIFPFRIGDLGEIRPSFMVMAVYYWAIMCPSMLSPLAAFAAGAAFDLVIDCPLGLNALTLVVVQWTTRAQRKFLLGQPFLMMWAGLGLVAMGAGILQWALVSLFNWTLLSIETTLVGGLLTAVLFPLAVVPLSVFNKPLADRNSSL
ncbi:MAG: rod shape-determining protein MreD [Alphaproteobacteria bacterium]|nr:MAG: rod shape-determining protein MreD [Alphaproteobacteria bacterium]